MISSLRGIVSHVGLNSAVVDVNGFGMLVQATPQTLATLHVGREAELATLMIVREDSMTLYAFEDSVQREVFETLISVSGVGPRLGLAALAVHPPEALRQAVADGDSKAISKVPGIGPKLAGRIVLELAGKLVPVEGPAAPAEPGWQDQVLQALTGLGWSEKDAAAALDRTAEDHPDVAAGSDVGQMLRLTLRGMGQENGRTGGSRRAAAGAR
jgi:holliday junction DNA helicase RuvA